MIDLIVGWANSTLGTIIGQILINIVFVFFYYYLLLILAMILMHKNTKNALLSAEDTAAKGIVYGTVLVSIVLGINMSMYSLGFYSEGQDIGFLFLISVVIPMILLSMLEIMRTHMSGDHQFYDLLISFIVVVAFLSPTKGLLTMQVLQKMYLIIALLVTFILLTKKPFILFPGKVVDKYSKFVVKNFKPKEVSK